MKGKEVTWYEVHRYNRAGFDCDDSSQEFDTLEEAEQELKELRRWYPKERFGIVKRTGTIIWEREEVSR